jgi:hypothetical protein
VFGSDECHDAEWHIYVNNAKFHYANFDTTFNDINYNNFTYNDNTYNT